VSRLSHTMPTRVTASPAASSRPLPYRRVSLGTSSATAKLTTVIGRKAAPATTGLGELPTRSDTFRTRWAAPNVRVHRTGSVALHHPRCCAIDHG
jgi:hypothetical protein